MNIDAMIRTQIQARRRRSYAKQAMQRVLSEHRGHVQAGRSLLVANNAMVSVLREYSVVGAPVGEPGMSQDPDQAATGGVIRTIVKAGLERTLEPAVASLLDSFGVTREEHPHLNRAMTLVVKNAISDIVVNPRYKILSLSCEDVGRALANACAESLPEAVFDTLIGQAEGMGEIGQRFLSKDSPLARTIREAISNFFAKQDVIQRIADEFSRLVCEIDLSEVIASGGREIMGALRGRED